MDIISDDELGFMATLGHIGKFNSADESISAYLERIELFFAANGIEDEKQMAVFLSVIGAKNYAYSVICWHLKSHKKNHWRPSLKPPESISSQNLL